MTNFICLYIYKDMADVIPSNHGGDGSDEPPSHPPSTVLVDCESALPPKRRQHYKSLIIFQLYNKLHGVISIQFDLEGKIFYAVREYSEYYVRHIGSLIRQLIPSCYQYWKMVPNELRVPLLSQVKVKNLNLTQFSLK